MRSITFSYSSKSSVVRSVNVQLNSLILRIVEVYTKHDTTDTIKTVPIVKFVIW